MSTAGRVVHSGRVTTKDLQRDPYLYLPFEVPATVTRIDVILEHDSGNVIDLGLLDTRAVSFPSPVGFRGWSGGARDRFFVATDAATPGYLPGEMPAGEWQVVLGLYRIREEGCAYTVTVTLDESPRSLIGSAQQHPTLPVTAGWYPGDLQSHTHHSDAQGSLDDLIAAARERGLRFLAVTDHNTTSHHRHLAELSSEELFLLPGEEVTTDRGHANVWGARDWIDFRITEESHVEKMVARAHDLGGVVSINHPKSGGPAWRYPVPRTVDCVEAWQAPWPFGNEESLAFYDALLAEGRRPVLVGGSDRHQPGWPDPDPIELQVGSPTTWLWLEELSVPACLRAIRSGRVFVSEGPAGPRLELSLGGVPMGGVLYRGPGSVTESSPASPSGADWATAAVFVESSEDTKLRLIGSGGVLVDRDIVAGTNRLEVQVALRDADGFLRAELWHPEFDRVVALSNPVFIETDRQLERA